MDAEQTETEWILYVLFKLLKANYNFNVLLLFQEEDSHSKPSGGFHANGQSEPDLWSNSSALSMEHMEPRRPKLTFNNTYVTVTVW